jgi:hypothetical protein
MVRTFKTPTSDFYDGTDIHSQFGTVLNPDHIEVTSEDMYFVWTLEEHFSRDFLDRKLADANYLCGVWNKQFEANDDIQKCHVEKYLLETDETLGQSFTLIFKLS